MLPVLPTIAIWILILGILVVAHEFGHFVTAKHFDVEAPEFAIGIPPRLFTFWRTGGWIEIQGRRISVPARLRLPAGLAVGNYVRYHTRKEKGKEVLTSIELVPDEEAADTLASPVQNLDHGTIYTLNMLPIGGYVLLSGQEDPNAPNALAAKPAWQRMIVLSAGVVMNLILAFITLAILAMVLPRTVTAVTTQVVGVLPNTPAATAGLQAGDTIVSINGLDVRDNRDKMLAQIGPLCGRQIMVGIERPDPKGGISNLTLPLTPKPSADLPCALGVSINTAIGQPVGAVAPGSLAAQAGIKPGDALVKVGSFDLIPATSNGFTTHLPGTSELAAYIQQNSLVPTILPVYLIRDGHILAPVKVKVPEGVDAQQASLGITLEAYRTVPQAAGEGLNQMRLAVSLLPRTFSGIANGITSGTDTGVGGPIRIGQAIAEGTPTGGVPFLLFLFGNISLSLAVFNLFPIPGLDGARLVFVLLEVIRGGRKLDPRFEGIVNLVGMAVVLAFILFVSYSDLLRLQSGRSAFGP